MAYDDRFYLIDRTGARRYAAKFGDAYQIGKTRDEEPPSLSRFASAVLKESKGGRFESACGKKGILGYGGRSREAVAYGLDPAVAAMIGVPARGTLTS